MLILRPLISKAGSSLLSPVIVAVKCNVSVSRRGGPGIFGGKYQTL
jgi:hypothetical protein